MRKYVVVMLVLGVLVFGVMPSGAQNTPGITIADVIATLARAENPEFTQFSRAVAVANPSVLALLQNPNANLTLFAPTDAAFAKIRETRYGRTTLNMAFADSSLMTNLTRYHIVRGAFPIASLESLAAEAQSVAGISLPTEQGQFIRVTVGDDERLTIDGEASTVLHGVAVTFAMEGELITLAGRQINTQNGVIHVIDTVLVPTTDNMLQVIEDINLDFDGEFNTLLATINAADSSIRERLANPNAQTTLFAPTDAAFELLGEARTRQILQNPEALRDLLQYHLLDGRVSSQDMTNAMAASRGGNGELVTQLGRGAFRRTAVVVSSLEDGLVVNGGAMLVVLDIDAGNGLIHVIDHVLEPPR